MLWDYSSAMLDTVSDFPQSLVKHLLHNNSYFSASISTRNSRALVDLIPELNVKKVHIAVPRHQQIAQVRKSKLRFFVYMEHIPR